MKPNDLKTFLTNRFKAGTKRAVHIESSPGLGKTQICGQVAKELGIGYKVIHAPTMQPEDMGFPVITQDKSDVNFIVSKVKFPMIGSDCPETGILLIDELPQADNSIQKVIANLIQEREIHGQHVKPGWMIVTTGNRTTDRAGANRLLSHLVNRLTRVELEASLDDWCKWALANSIPVELIAFLRFRPQLLSAFDPQQETSPTPRSWAEGVACAFGNVKPEFEFEVFKGDVGEAAAAEFCAFIKIFRKLPSPDAIIVNPQSVAVPTDPATLYALCGALSHRLSVTNFGRILTYVKRMPLEFGVMFINDSIRRLPEIQQTSDFIQWAATDGANILT